MTDYLTRAIREHIIAYLTGEQTLLDFQDWLVGATWDVEEEGEPEAVDMTYEIKLDLAEQSRGDVNLSEVRRRLSKLVEMSERVVKGGAA